MADGTAATSPFIRLAELAARWGTTEAEAIAIVRWRDVPFLRVSAAMGRVNWRKVRFSIPAIEAWEASHQEVFRGGSPPEPRPDRPSVRTAPAPTRSRLGDWRRSSPV